ncbi:hypothetical protein [Teredinibacter purpureus]|uniref:hypothetical protein n=1 Tax=Teredinibacter purpureus TaxID=2731756 RepID=UPI0005F833F9|nr:hypothetical protein [Teredinibacter purpureus]
MSWSALKVSHPLKKWVAWSMLFALLGILLIFFGLNAKVVNQGVVISPGPMFLLGLAMYVFWSAAFLYLKLSPRIRRIPAGSVNIERLSNFAKTYPQISKEYRLETYCNGNTTYGEIQIIQKKANKSLVQLASRSVMRRR